MTDRLSRANVIAEAKIERSVAERIATEIFDAIHDNVATKQDLREAIATLKHELTVRFASVMVVLLTLLFAALRYLPPAHWTPLDLAPVEPTALAPEVIPLVKGSIAAQRTPLCISSVAAGPPHELTLVAL